MTKVKWQIFNPAYVEKLVAELTPKDRADLVKFFKRNPKPPR